MSEIQGRGGGAAQGAPPQRPPKAAAVWAPAFLASGFAALAVVAFGFPQAARGFPLLVLAVTSALFFAVTLLNAKVARGHGLRGSQVSTPAVSESLRSCDGRISVAGFVAVWSIYPVAMMGIGFILATTAALSASFLILRVRRPLRWAFGTVPATLLFFGLLQIVLNIALPQAPLDGFVADFFYQMKG